MLVGFQYFQSRGAELRLIARLDINSSVSGMENLESAAARQSHALMTDLALSFRNAGRTSSRNFAQTVEMSRRVSLAEMTGEQPSRLTRDRPTGGRDRALQATEEITVSGRWRHWRRSARPRVASISNTGSAATPDLWPRPASAQKHAPPSTS